MAYELALYRQQSVYPARMDRFLIERVFNGRNRVFNGLVATQRGLGANFTIDVSVGAYVMAGSLEANTGMYLGRLTAIQSVPVPSTPGTPTRTDGLYIWVRDSQAGGVIDADWTAAGGSLGDTWMLKVFAGGAALPPGNIMQIATIDRTSGESNIATSAIHDIAPRGTYPYTVAATPPVGIGVQGDLWVQV